MKNSVSRAMLLVLALALMAVACGSSDSGSITVEDVRYRLSRSDLGAGYLSVTNTTSDAVTLEAASADGVGRIELHESIAADDGTMSMQSRPEGFQIAAGETVTLQPGGKHLMIFDPTGPAEDLNLTLDFGTESIEVVATYDAEASAAAMSDDAMGDMDHSDMEDMEGMEDMDNSDDDAMDDDAMDDGDS